MLNAFRLRAKWTRAKRKKAAPDRKDQVALIPRTDDTRVSLYQYLLALQHMAKCWTLNHGQELEWFFESIRGNLPPKPEVGVAVHFVYLPLPQYLMALEVLTTRLGVKP